MSKEPEQFDKVEHDAHNPHHSGELGHDCWEFDGLYICKDCSEFQFCECFKDDNE